MSTLVDHPTAFVRLTATAVDLVARAGAATQQAIHREFPYCGYRDEEVLRGLDAMVEAGLLNQTTDGDLRIYTAGPGFPKLIEADQ